MGRKGLSAPGQAGQAVTLWEARAGPHHEPLSPFCELLHDQWPSDLTGLLSPFASICLNVYVFPFPFAAFDKRACKQAGSKESHLETFSEALFGKEFLALHCFHRPEEERQRYKKRGHAPESINLGFDNTTIKRQSYPLWGGFRNLQPHRDFRWQTSECPLASQATRHAEMKGSPRAEAGSPRAEAHIPHHPRSVKSVAAPAAAAGTDLGLFSHLWPGGWTGSPQRGPGPPCLLAFSVEIPSEWKTETAFSWRHWQNLPLYFYNLYISSSFYKQKTKQEKAHDSFICSPVQQQGHCLPGSLTPVLEMDTRNFSCSWLRLQSVSNYLVGGHMVTSLF